MKVTYDDVCRGASELGLQGLPVCVHASLRSFGHLEGGAAGFVAALLANQCTVLVPAFTWTMYAAAPPADLRPLRNGTDFSHEFPAPHGRIYTPACNDLDLAAMGRVAAAVLARPDRNRGNHPLMSFTAVGPLAHELVQGQTSHDAYAPLRSLAHLGGLVLLVGVDLTKMTLMHLAEKEAGRVQFRRWALNDTGRVEMVEVGGCSGGFENLRPLLAEVERNRKVGRSEWRAYPARQTLRIAVQAILDDNGITACGDAQCERCWDALAGGPILETAR